jgi:hypothetical protein
MHGISEIQEKLMCLHDPQVLRSSFVWPIYHSKCPQPALRQTINVFQHDACNLLLQRRERYVLQAMEVKLYCSFTGKSEIHYRMMHACGVDVSMCCQYMHMP